MRSRRSRPALPEPSSTLAVLGRLVRDLESRARLLLLEVEEDLVRCNRRRRRSLPSGTSSRGSRSPGSSWRRGLRRARPCSPGSSASAAARTGSSSEAGSSRPPRRCPSRCRTRRGRARGRAVPAVVSRRRSYFSLQAACYLRAVERVDLHHLRAPAVTRDDPHRPRRHVERRSEQLDESLVRPSALRRSRYPRLPAVAVPPHELRAGGAGGDGDANPSRRDPGRAPRRPRCSRPPPRPCVRSRASTPPRGRAS